MNFRTGNPNIYERQNSKEHKGEPHPTKNKCACPQMWMISVSKTVIK